ncbi:uncharacterized protein EAF02_006284 [Botrytis sinoallii]|uniref:uncharacterized protein n=1 Tax=Botrytis sinoallii TaxID=1463999 RepID=UPI001901DCCE|nr:uncharacterized protein EAF02_006284 [Botrytis sinoallii]KAF7881596.1 hypothetical protein EAF02_006284 [Botrytis sinoallii]
MGAQRSAHVGPQKEGRCRQESPSSNPMTKGLQAAHIDLAALNLSLRNWKQVISKKKRKNENFAVLEEDYIKRSGISKQDIPQRRRSKTVEYKDLREKHFDLQDKMAEATVDNAATIAVLEAQITKLELQIVHKDKYIEHLEVQTAAREEVCTVREQRCNDIEGERRNLKSAVTDLQRKSTETRRKMEEVKAENESMIYDCDRYKENLADLETENENLVKRVAAEKQRVDDFRHDAREVQKENKKVQEALVKKEQETQELLEKMEKANKYLVAKGGVGVSPEVQKLMRDYIEMCRSIIKQIIDTRMAQNRFQPAPGTYQPTDGDSRRGSAAGSKDSSESSSSSSSSEAEDEEEEEEVVEGEGEGIPDLQVINKKTRRRGHGLAAGPEIQIQIKEVEVIREVQIPGPERLVPGPIQYVDREVPVPGPTVFVDVPGADIPGPNFVITPFRVFAHNPVICWLLVEFNFLILFFHWCKRSLSVLSRLPAMTIGLGPWNPPPPDDDDNSDSDDDDAAGEPPDGKRPPKTGPKLLSVLFNPKRGRLPNAWDTFWGLVFHMFVYSVLWLFLSVAYERKLWLAENDSTRRWLYQIIAQHGGNGFLGMNQILPQRVIRLLEIWRFDLLERMGYPLAYQFPG